MCDTSPAWVPLAQGIMFIISAITIVVGLVLTIRRLERVSKILVVVDETIQEVNGWREKH